MSAYQESSSAPEKIAERDAVSRQQDATTRYQAALGFGADFVNFMNSNINVESKYGKGSTDELIRTRSAGQTSTYVSAKGTVIGVDRVGYTSNENNTIQITRKDGLQLNIELDDNLRINDLEDGGISIYYASSGITRIFDAEGNESTIQGEKNILGTSDDDIIINKSSTYVDAGDGDDTIINFADGAKLLGGSGNDKILLYSSVSTGMTIDGGEGDDIIVGHDIDNSNIVMKDGKDSLTATLLYKNTITSSNDDNIKTNNLIGSTLISNNGTFRMDIGNILESSVSIDRAKGFSVGNIRGSHLTFGNDGISINASSINNSYINTGNGNDVIIAQGIDNSVLNTGEGNDVIKVALHTDGSTIKTGKGDDTIYSLAATNSHTESLCGNCVCFAHGYPVESAA